MPNRGTKYPVYLATIPLHCYTPGCILDMGGVGGGVKRPFLASAGDGWALPPPDEVGGGDGSGVSGGVGGDVGVGGLVVVVLSRSELAEARGVL